MSFLRSKLVQKPYQLFHYYFLSEASGNSNLAALEFSTDINITLKKLRNHHWKLVDIGHYGFLSAVIAFVFIIFPASFLIKLPILLIFATCFLVPLTSQFFLHALPIFSWLALFFTCGKIPNEWKPAISVKFLPAMETILYGDNLSNVLATVTNSFLDMVAWLPYGIIHFSSPFVVAIFIFIFGPPTSLRSFGFAFGYMNLFGVLVQLLLPAAPPWYKNLYGLQPADYSMKGSPGGLGRVDEILGVDMYTTAFSNSPVVFGAFPSLHSACAVMDVLFLCWLFPKYRGVWWGYACWLWWSTMYLTHHYFFDLTSGAFLAVLVFTYTKYQHLPVIKASKFCRWSYTEISYANIDQIDPLNFNFNEFIYENDLELNVVESFEPDRRSNPSASSGPNQSNSNTSVNGLNPYNYDTRSRQTSKSFLPLNPSILEDEETSSFDNSAATSVFDDVDQLTTITSNEYDDIDKKKK